MIDLLTEEPGFIAFSGWDIGSEEPDDRRQHFQPLAPTLEALLYRLAEGKYVPIDHASAKDLNDLLPTETPGSGTPHNARAGERAIRKLIAEWTKATKEGDVECILDLVCEDATFLLAGQEPIRGRDELAIALRIAFESGTVKIASSIQEVYVEGNLAFCWAEVKVTTKLRNGGPPDHRSGPTLSIFRRHPDGHWRLFRDAGQ